MAARLPWDQPRRASSLRAPASTIQIKAVNIATKSPNPLRLQRGTRVVPTPTFDEPRLPSLQVAREKFDSRDIGFLLGAGIIPRPGAFLTSPARKSDGLSIVSFLADRMGKPYVQANRSCRGKNSSRRGVAAIRVHDDSQGDSTPRSTFMPYENRSLVVKTVTGGNESSCDRRPLWHNIAGSWAVDRIDSRRDPRECM